MYRIDGDLAQEYAKTGVWPATVQIPKSSSVLNSDWGIDWSQVPNSGYTLDINGNAIKDRYVPFIGENIDRYDPSNGRFTSPIIDGNAYNYNQRSLPYVEDLTQHHQYEVIGDYSKLEKYVNACTDNELATKIDDYVEAYYQGNYNNISVYKGEIAGGFNSTGGGVQLVFNMSCQCQPNG